MPPGLRSTLVETTSKPFGPHHFLSALASVQAFHTRLPRCVDDASDGERLVGRVVPRARHSLGAAHDAAPPLFAVKGAPERLDVELFHVEIGFRHARDFSRVLIHQHVDERGGHDLP